MTGAITGIFNILATPFDASQAVDVVSLRRLVEFQLDKGVYGLTILGVLGEAAKLTVEERRLVLDTVMATVNGRVPVVVGTSHAKIETCIELSQSAFKAGASGVMIAPPRMPEPLTTTSSRSTAVSRRASLGRLSCRISPRSTT